MEELQELQKKKKVYGYYYGYPGYYPHPSYGYGYSHGYYPYGNYPYGYGYKYKKPYYPKKLEGDTKDEENAKKGKKYYYYPYPKYGYPKYGYPGHGYPYKYKYPEKKEEDLSLEDLWLLESEELVGKLVIKKNPRSGKFMVFEVPEKGLWKILKAFDTEKEAKDFVASKEKKSEDNAKKDEYGCVIGKEKFDPESKKCVPLEEKAEEVGKDEYGCVIGKERFDQATKKCVPLEEPAEKAGPRTDEERAMAHFNISKEEWDKLPKEKQDEYIKKLPKRGAAEEKAKVKCPKCGEEFEDDKKLAAHIAEKHPGYEYPGMKKSETMSAEQKPAEQVQATPVSPPQIPVPSPEVKPLEPPKVETPKVEPAKVEPPKVEPPKVEEKPVEEKPEVKPPEVPASKPVEEKKEPVPTPAPVVPAPLKIEDVAKELEGRSAETLIFLNKEKRKTIYEKEG